MTMMSVSTDFEARVKQVLEERSMLKHPFYVEWTQGTLPMHKMQEYARQYYHLGGVPATAEFYPRPDRIAEHPPTHPGQPLGRGAWRAEPPGALARIREGGWGRG